MYLEVLRRTLFCHGRVCCQVSLKENTARFRYWIGKRDFKELIDTGKQAQTRFFVDTETFCISTGYLDIRIFI